MTEPIVPRRTYFLAYFTLLGLTALTTLIAFVDLGPFNTIAAIGIAIVKASLIAAFFMHVIYEFKLIWVIIAGAILWFCLLLMTFSDYVSRPWTSQ